MSFDRAKEELIKQLRKFDRGEVLDGVDLEWTYVDSEGGDGHQLLVHSDGTTAEDLRLQILDAKRPLDLYGLSTVSRIDVDDMVGIDVEGERDD
jgi:hypothetical protein